MTHETNDSSESLPRTLKPERFREVPGGSIANTIVGFEGRDIRSRPFNLLRSQVLRLLDDGKRVLGITSATPGVGKTFTACNLAASLSRLPEIETYLLDLDLRRASVAERFGLPDGIGLSDFFSGTDRLADIAWHIEDQRLIIYPTFNQNVLSAELVASQRMTDLMLLAHRESNAVTICDLPPVFANDDALIIAEHIDCYLVVVEDGATTASQLRNAIQLIGEEKFGGTVLNRYIKSFASDPYGYSGYGGKYAKYYG